MNHGIMVAELKLVTDSDAEDRLKQPDHVRARRLAILFSPKNNVQF